MKKSIPLLLIASAVSLPVLGRPVAADVPVFVPAVGEQPRPYTIKVKNMAASEMAWLLDPNNNSAPVAVRVSNQQRELYFPTVPDSSPIQGYGTQPAALQRGSLPEGIDRIIAIDPQNALLVFGTASGMDALRTRIESFDKPKSQLDLQVSYIKFKKNPITALGLEPASAAMSSGPLGMAFLSDGMVSRIDEMVKDKSAFIVTAPRLTVSPGLTGSLRFSDSISAAVGVNAGGKFQGVPDLGDGNFKLRQSMGITVTPQVSSDSDGGASLSFEMVTGRVLQLIDTQSNQPIWHRDLDGVQSVSGIKDGQTFVLMGADTRILGGLDGKKSKPANLLILVTPRLIHHAT